MDVVLLVAEVVVVAAVVFSGAAMSGLFKASWVCGDPLEALSKGCVGCLRADFIIGYSENWARNVCFLWYLA